MPIEIRELLIKVKIEESSSNSFEPKDMHQLQENILKECKKEIRKQFQKLNER